MTHITRLTVAALCIACWLVPASHAQTPKALPRIAIIAASDDRDAASLADLLTAAMSQNTHGYELIERAELNRIAQEAEVQAMSAAKRPRALARLAKADGLILLTTELAEDGRRSVSARLSSTGSGMILQSFMLAADAKDLPTAANLAADAMRFAAARTGKSGDTVPHIVSLLGIRANTGQEGFPFGRWHWQLAESPDFFPTFLHSYHRALAYADELLAMEWNPFPGSIWRNDSDFASRAALMGCQFLVAAHRMQMHLKYPGEVASVRARTEALANFHLSKRKWNGEHRLAFYAGYWAATPDAAVGHWREFLKPDTRQSLFELQRRRDAVSHEFDNTRALQMAARRPALPLIVDWHGADNTTGEAAWQHLLATLRDSGSLANQSDGFALAIYSGRNPDVCERLLASYLDTLERNRAALATAPGQVALFSYDPKIGDLPRTAEVAGRFAGILGWTLENARKIEQEVFLSMLKHVEVYVAESPGKRLQISCAAAAQLNSAIQKYLARLAASGQPVDRKNLFQAALLDTAAAIKNAYPEAAGTNPLRETPALPAPDAIPLRFIPLAKQSTPTDRRFWASTYSTTTCGDNFLVERYQMAGSGFLEIRPDLSTREIPAPPQTLFKEAGDRIGSSGGRLLPASDGFYARSWHDNFLHFSHARSAWSDASSLLGGQRFTTVGMAGGSFYAAKSDSGFTLGKIRNGAFELIASSRRRPAEHPLDDLAGARVSAVFAGAKARPCALLTFSNHTEFHDIELRRRICSLSGGAKVSLSGKVPIIEDIWVVAAIDADSGEPRALIRRPFTKIRNTSMLDDDLPRETVWDWPKTVPVDFSQGVNFVTTACAVRGDHLFLLKCEHSLDFIALSKRTQPSHDRLTLLCYRPGHRDPLEIPLVFDAGVLAPFGLGGGANSATALQPEFNTPRVCVTSAGLFFQFHERWLPENGKGTPKPGLLHIAWKDVNDWLTRHGNAPIRADATPGAMSPSR